MTNGTSINLPPKELKKLEKTFQQMKEIAREDPVYFVDTFLYTFNPKQEPFHLRFKTFPFQKRLIRDLVYAIKNGEDIFIDKCREMGVTYTILATFIWFWLFEPASNFLIGSRKEDYVDNRRGGTTGNKEESLFGKIDYMLSRLPTFMLPQGYNPDKHFNYMSLVNPEMGNVISGESSNQNFSRGGRQRAIFLDEFAFWDNDCWRKDTEVLTKEGWKNFQDCTMDDQIYSMNIDTGHAEYMPVTKLHKVYAPKLYEFKNKSVDLSCTPNHKLLLKKRYTPKGTREFFNKNKDKSRYEQSTGKMYFRRADEVYYQKHDYIPLVSDYIGGESPETIYGFDAEDYMEFLGWYISEGCFTNKNSHYYIEISQVKEKGKKQIEDLLIKMGLKIKYYGSSFKVLASDLPKEMFEELISLGKAHQKHIPRKYLNLNKDLLKTLFDSLMAGDDCITKRKDRVDKMMYATTSKKLADDFQELAQKIGLHATITHVDRDEKWKRIYLLNIGTKPHARVASLNKQIVDYNDYAYCVTTPYHSLYVRRNGVASWAGNTAVWGSTADTTNCRIVATTPGIKPSKAKRLRFGKDGEKIKVITLTYKEDPRKTRKWLNEQRERRSIDDFNREIMINWETSITGRVYPEIENAAFGDFPFLANSPLWCSWDFGLDGVAILFWQQNKDNGKYRLIDAYMNEDKPIQYYLPLFGRPIDSKFTYTDDDLKAITQIANYPKAIHFGDPDVKKRSLLTGTSTRQELEKAGIYVQCIDKNDFYFRREKTKIYLQAGIEINANPRTEYAYEAFKSARYPQREETSQATTPIALPIHDWTSHPRTSMEFFFVNIDVFENMQFEAPSWANKTKKWVTSKLKISGRSR
ncbi:MAG: LAGLIDADG family homing endonuclease [Patescibacteria group bacterium]|jgi:hypothetical protein